MLHLKNQYEVAADDKRAVILILTEIKKMIDSRLLALSPEYDMPINKLVLSKRILDCLHNANIKTVGELVKKTEAQLFKSKNFGPKSIKNIKGVLAEMNLSLAKN